MTSAAHEREILEVVRKSPFFGVVGEGALGELLSGTPCHAYPKNNILFYQGDSTRTVYLVVKGLVKISLISEDAREVVVSLIRPGGLVGLVSLIDEEPQPVTAMTVSRSRLVRLRGPAVMEWAGRYPEFRECLLQQLTRELRRAYHKIGEHALMSVKERLLYTLLEIAEREGEPGGDGHGELVFTRPTHQELAERIGSSREVVSRVLKEILESELLQADGRVIRVPQSALVLRDE